MGLEEEDDYRPSTGECVPLQCLCLSTQLSKMFARICSSILPLDTAAHSPIYWHICVHGWVSLKKDTPATVIVHDLTSENNGREHGNELSEIDGES